MEGPAGLKVNREEMYCVGLDCFEAEVSREGPATDCCGLFEDGDCEVMVASRLVVAGGGAVRGAGTSDGRSIAFSLPLG